MRAVGFLLLVLLQLAAPASAQDTSPLGMTAKTWRPLLSLPGAAQNQRPEAGQKLAQMCPFGWGFCPGGFCAPLGSVCCPGGYCQQGQSCCGSQCCNAGAYCSRIGCVPIGSVECGTGFCNPGFKCAGFNRCIPFDAMDCGDGRHCNPGFKCASGNSCIPLDAVDCGNGRSCRAGFLCVGADRCMTQQQIDFEQAERERRRLEAERRTQEQAAEQRRLAELRQLANDTQQCSQYLVAHCDAALASPHVGAGERERLVAWRTTAFKLASDRADCEGGSASACDAALASPALAAADRAEIERLRAQTSLMHRTLAFVRETGSSAAASAQSLVTSVRDLPTSTHVVGGIAIGLALALLALFAVRRRGPRMATEVGTPAVEEPPADRPVDRPLPGSEAPPPPPRPPVSLSGGPPSRAGASIMTSSTRADRGPATSAPPEMTSPSQRLGRLLAGIGTAGVVLSFFWWLIFYASVAQALGAPTREFGPLVRCLFMTTGPCALIKTIANAAGYLAYEPSALWISAAILVAGIAVLNNPGLFGESASGRAPPDSYDRRKFEALVNYDPDIKAAADRVRPLGEKWVAVLARDYLTLNAKEYLPSIVSKIEAEAAREAEEMRNLPYVVEEGLYRNRKWRRLNTGTVEGEMLNGGMQNFESLEAFQRFVG